MAETSKIAWTDATWNPTTGCSHVSPGCENCYAEALSLRRGWSAKPWTKPNAAENVILHPDRFSLPLRWKEPRRVFVDSMSDLFHENIPDWFILNVFSVMEATKRHIYQILTKRPERMQAWTSAHARWVENAAGEGEYLRRYGHVWLGVSVEDQRRADERIPLLLETPAAVRFLSCEPLLGPLDLDPWLSIQHFNDALTNIFSRFNGEPAQRVAAPPGVDWVIVGGESGPGYRPMELEWARDIRDQCKILGVSFFFKQSSGARPGSGVELDGQIWHEFPQQTETGRSTEGVHGAND